MPPIPDGGHLSLGPQSSGKGYVLGSPKTGSGGQWKEAGRGGGGKVRPCFIPPVSTESTHSSLPCPTFRFSVGKEERDSHTGEETALKSSERKEKSQNHRRRKGF